MATRKRCNRRYVTLLAFTSVAFLWVGHPAAADMMSTTCKNKVVSVGDRKGEVLAKCGEPLSKSHDRVDTRTTKVIKKKTDKKQTDKGNTAQTGEKKSGKTVTGKTVITRAVTKEREETWTYNIEGSYRFLVFKEGRLERIEAGGLAN